jgi:hypothetical protein
LWFVVGVEYSAEERDQYNPDWIHHSHIPFEFAEGQTMATRAPQRSQPAMHSAISNISPRSASAGRVLWDHTIDSILIHFEFTGGARQVLVTDDVFFSDQDGREKFIALLHDIHVALTLAAESWWNYVAPVYGDEQVTEHVTEFRVVRTDSAFNGAIKFPGVTDEVVRRIRIE